MVHNTAEDRPKVGIGVMIVKNGAVLLGKRKNSHGVGEYAFPGGHLEHLESFHRCAEREVAEECGLTITNIQFQFVANVTKYAPKHYVHIGVTADWVSGQPYVLEPNLSDTWHWYKLNALPTPLFEMCKLAFESQRTGKSYYDT